jgi:tetratricopeptide (TPR) repeat protein
MKTFDVMEYQKKAALIFVGCCLIIFAVLMYSCERLDQSHQTKNKEQKAFYQAFTKAGFYVNRNPDSAILFADSALVYAHIIKLSDTSLIPVLFLKSDAFVSLGLSDSAMIVLLRAHYISVKASDNAYIAKSNLRMGRFLRNQEQSTLAEKYTLEALRVFELLGDKRSFGNACDLYGNLLSDMGNYIKAHEYLMKAYEISEQLGDIKTLGDESINIGFNYRLMGNMEEAIRYSRIGCERIAQVQDTASLIVAYNNLGIALRTVRPDSSMFFYRKSLALNRESSTMNSIITRFNIANLYFDKKDYSMALHEFDTVLSLCRQNRLLGGMARVYHAFGEIYVLTQDFPRADFYLKQSIRMADSLGLLSLVPDFSETLLRSYKVQGKMTEYTRLSNKVMAQRDSVTHKDKQATIAYIAKYQKAEKKELENVNLSSLLKNKENKLLLSKIIIAVIVLAIVLLGLLLKRNTRLSKERGEAFDKLIKLYREERAQRDKQAEAILSAGNTPFDADTLTVESQVLMKQLHHYYETEKPYLNPRLRVEDIAETLNTTRKAIASLLSLYSNSNFVSFTNMYRVEHAIMLTESAEGSNYKISAIATDAGFGSAQSFYRAFQQVTGVLPHYYRKTITKPGSETAT